MFKTYLFLFSIWQYHFLFIGKEVDKLLTEEQTVQVIGHYQTS